MGITMACGGCGDGSNLRQQHVERKKQDIKVIQYKVSRSSDQQVVNRIHNNIRRQTLVRDDRCNKCGYPIMLVDIAGRERKQCTNCRILQ